MNGMLALLIVLALDIIGCTLIYLFISEKIKIGSPFFIYPFLTLLPTILLFALFICMEFFILIPLTIFASEIIVILIIIFIKINKLPWSRTRSENNNIIKMYSRRLLHYSIYTNLLYFIPLISIVIMLFIGLILNIEFFKSMINNISNFITTQPQEASKVITGISLWAVVLAPNFVPVLVIIFLIPIVFVIIILALSLNGTISLIKASKQIKQNRVLYIILMLLPVANIFCMLHLCSTIKKELKDTNI